jgi:cob(I)alamin adenosyltransferase
MKIYTKAGDNGTTSIVGGTRVSKADLRLDVYGTIDELNAQIGVVIEHCSDEKDRQFLSKIQEELFQVGLVFATDWEKFDASSQIISEESIEHLEREIDKISVTLPELKNFVMPRGSVVSAFIHVARTVCRRAERLAVGVEVPFSNRSIQYLNRLSDYLFVLARKNT